MKINIGDNNKINSSIVGSNNNSEKEKNFLNSVLKIIAEIIVGLIVGFCIYKFGWNK